MKKIWAVLFLLLSTATVSWGASCEEALKVVFKNEGGFQNSKNDTGNFIKGKNCGGTKYGVTCRDGAWFLRKKKITIKDLTLKQASEYYQTTACGELKFTELEGQKIPNKMLDLAVNLGSGTAIKLVIKTIDRLNETQTDIPVKPVMTKAVIDWYNAYTADKDQRSIFYLALILEALDRYSDIVESNPKQAQWLLGWIIRLNPYSD